LIFNGNRLTILAVAHDGVVVRHFESARELWVHLMDPGSFLGKGWVFRGQRDARWDLSPRALRPNELNRYLPRHLRNDAPSSLKEILAIHLFAHGCNAAGLPSAGGWELFTRTARIERDDSGRDLVFIGDKLCDVDSWPMAHIDIVALAQHHGIPTRLLDWTPRPAVAAYFAAMDAALDLERILKEVERTSGSAEALDRRIRDVEAAHARVASQAPHEVPLPSVPGRGDLAIWCVRLGAVSALSEEQAWSDRVHCSFAASHTHQRLHSQAGVFSVVSGEAPRALDLVLNDHVPPGKQLPLAIKCTLPWFEARGLLSIVEQLAGVTEYSVYPDYNAVARSLFYASALDDLQHRGKQVGLLMDSEYLRHNRPVTLPQREDT
jgi:hypothetical protein